MNNRKSKSVLIRVFIILAAFCVALPAAAATVTATLDNSTIVLGEVANLEIYVEGGSPNAVPPIPKVQGLQIDHTGVTRKFSMINGQAQSGISITYVVSASQRGDFTIPKINVVVDGKNYSTNPLKLKVGGEDDVIKQMAFLRIQTPRQDVYLGEVLPLDVLLFAQNGREVSNPQLDAGGFTTGPVKQLEQSRQNVGGAVYAVLPFQTTVTPVRVGKLTLSAANSLVVQVATSRRTRDAFDFLDPFGSSARLQRISLKSEPMTITVNPLPRENVPADFKGAIGDFNFTVTASPTNVAVGDPVTLKMVVSGKGAIDGISGPVIDGWREFKVYPPVTRIETNDSLGLQGSKTFEQVVIPENSEVKEIPPISFSYFDPQKKLYQTLKQSAIALIVRPVAGGGVQPVLATSPSSGSSAPAPAQQQQDIVYIKTRPGTLAQIQPPLVMQNWFMVLNTLPFILWLSTLAWRKRVDYLANNPKVRRQKQAAEIIRAGLADLNQQATARDSEAFHSTLFRLLQEQLGERLDLPASAITEEVIAEKLHHRGLNQNVQNELHDLFQTCNRARYAPVSSTEVLTSLIPRLENALCEVRKLQ